MSVSPLGVLDDENLNMVGLAGPNCPIESLRLHGASSFDMPLAVQDPN